MRRTAVSVFPLPSSRILILKVVRANNPTPGSAKGRLQRRILVLLRPSLPFADLGVGLFARPFFAIKILLEGREPRCVLRVVFDFGASLYRFLNDLKGYQHRQVYGCSTVASILHRGITNKLNSSCGLDLDPGNSWGSILFRQSVYICCYRIYSNKRRPRISATSGTKKLISAALE